ncbi:MAG: hypothetical protein LBF64_01950, partial [Oscillospiraceae bacterium]|nr:hypothetical protein [Oscillospiraceae bacterium]
DVSNPALSWTDYTVEQDITITAVALGVYFRAADDTHAYMWQFRADNNTVVPHLGNNSAMAVEGSAISLPAGTLAANKTVRVKIQVTGADPVRIAAYVDDTPDNGEDNYTLAGERAYTAAAQRVAAGSVGYRTGNSERGYVDNVVVRSSVDGSILYENDFTAAVPNQFGSSCTIGSGRLNVGTGSRAVLNPSTTPPEKNNFIFLRHTFQLAGTANIRKAIVSGGAYMVESGTSGDSLSYIYDLYMNGRSVGVGPARVHKYNMSGGLNTTAPNLYYYNSFDVTDLLQAGENVMAASNYSRSGKSVLFQLTVFYEDGAKEVLVNSARDRTQWRAKDGTGAFGDNSSFTNGGYVTQALEEMNGLYYPDGWNDVGFVEDDSWRVPGDKGPIDASSRILAPYTAENILRFDMPAVSRAVVNADGHEYQVLDLGKGIVGGIRLTIDNTTGSPFTLVVQPGESLIKATDPNPDSSTSGPVGTVRYDGWRDNPNYNMTWTIAPGLNVLPSMLMYNYRWIQFVDAPIEITTDMVTGLHVRQAFDDDASYLRSGDNEFFNRLVELVKYSIKATNQDQYTDSYSRERRAYEGDLILNQYGSYAFSDNYALARHTNQYLMDWPTWPPEYRLFSVEMAWADYLYTGDRANIEKYYALLDRKLPTSYGGEVNYQSGFNTTVNLCRDNRSAQSGGAIVDWPADEQDDYIRDGAGARQALNTTVGSFTTVYNAVAYGAYGDMAKIAALLGRADEAAWYQDKADAIKASLIEKLYNPETGAFWDSCRVDGSHTTHTAQHATAYALAYGVYTDQAMADKMVAFLRSYKAQNEDTAAARAYRGGYLRTSVYGAYFVLRGLYDAGAGDLAGEIMLEDDPSVVRSWAQMLETQQATITTEAWSPQLKNNMTYSHPWGGTPGALITQGIFGIKPLSPGFDLFQIKLQPGAELRTAEIKSPSVKGPIYASFDAGAVPSAFAANITIPANARARVSIPTDDPAREALVINGVKTPAVSDGRFLTVELGSGTYGIQIYDECAFEIHLDRAQKTVRVTGEGFAPGATLALLTAGDYVPTAQAHDYSAAVTADETGALDITLPAPVTEDLPWRGGHHYHVTLGGVAKSAPVPAAVRAHSSARISLRIKGKAPLNLDVEDLPEGAYAVMSSNPAVAAVEQAGGAWTVTGKKAGTALVMVRVAEEFGGAAHLVTVSVA